jgi:tetratricopeptide (TPR) repeat protein
LPASPTPPIPVKLPVFPCTAWLLLALLHPAPVSADAAVGQRIDALSQRIGQNPADQVLLLQRAMAYAESNQPDLALADVLRAEEAGDPVEAAFTHGVLLYRAGDYASALPYFNRYLQAYPQDRGSLDYRARLLRDTGKNREALADYETLLGLSDSLDPGYYIATARLLAGLPDRGVDEALALLDKRVAQRGPITPLQRYAIELEKGRGNYQRAIERMARLDQRLKATPQWQVEVAELLLMDARPGEALPYLSVAREQLESGRTTAVRRELLATTIRLQAEAQRAGSGPGATR